jgi:hypothetical protein
MDGVFDMQQWYGRGGFKFTHRNLRMEGVGKAGPTGPEITKLSKVPFPNLSEFDQMYFGCNRQNFLNDWINMPNALGLGFVSEGQLSGYGVIRRCREGYKIGPLFSDNAEIAEALFEALSDHAVGQPIYLDIPEINTAAMSLAEHHGLREVFGCARMYYGNPPAINWDKIYGITTFELG